MTYQFLEELKHFTIHKDDYDKLSIQKQQFLDDYMDLEVYPTPIKFNKITKIKQILKAYKKEISSNKHSTNTECIMILENLNWKN
jgi:hypothetical protein